MTMERPYVPGKFPRITPCGESALAVEFAPVISAAVNDRVHALAKNLAGDPLPGIVETVPAYSSLLVYFDLRRVRFGKLRALIRRRITQSAGGSAPAGTLFFIPVCYEGEFAEDLGEVASHTGLDPGEIIRRHTAPRYRIFMLGFLPGFPYLGGLDPRLETPRRAIPRTLVPRGAVGIGGNQTGIYPLASPGGWQLIGRTPLRPYDARREKPVLYRPGDFIAFFPISPKEYAEIEKQVEAAPQGVSGPWTPIGGFRPLGQGDRERAAPSFAPQGVLGPQGTDCVEVPPPAFEIEPRGIAAEPRGAGDEPCVHGDALRVHGGGAGMSKEGAVLPSSAPPQGPEPPWGALQGHNPHWWGMRIIQAGPLTTVQDRGRPGFMAAGFSPSGAMDDFSFSLANILAGNDEGEAALEMTMAGISAVFDGPAVIALTGADISPRIDGKPAAMNRALAVGAGSVLSSSFARGGCRSYLAVAGGLDLPPVLGSRSTNLKAGIGGLGGRKLQDGDYLPFRAPGSAPPAMERRACEGRPPAGGADPLVLHVVPGVQEDRFSPKGIRTFYTSVYTLSPDSDRMGIRFAGPPVESRRGTDIVSDGIAAGAVQIPPSGQPVVLMRDRQTTGGYAKIGTVAGADLSFLAQLLPGMPVEFKKISLRRAEGMYFRRLAELRDLKKK